MENNEKKYGIEKLIDIFTGNKPKYKQELMKLYDKEGEERQLLNLEDYEILEAIIKANEGNMSPKIMFATRFAYSEFWRWSFENGYVKKQNPFESSQFLNRLAMIVAFAESKTDVKVLTPEDIDDLVKNIYEKNGDVGYIQEIIIRGLFEGIKSIKDIAQIRMSAVDFKDRTIEFNGKKKKFSQKFFLCLEKYNNLQNITYEKNGIYTVDLLRYKDYLIKFNASKKTKQNQFRDDKEFVSKTRQKLNYHFDKFRKNQDNEFLVRNNILFYSGMIEYIRKIVEKQKNINSLMTCIIFCKGSNPTGLTLKEIIEKYDYNFEIKKRSLSIEKEILQLFLIKSPYFEPKSLNLNEIDEDGIDNLYKDIIL